MVKDNDDGDDNDNDNGNDNNNDNESDEIDSFCYLEVLQGTCLCLSWHELMSTQCKRFACPCLHRVV